jgi:hypothetical protein
MSTGITDSRWAALTATVGDPDGTRTVTSIVVLLVAIGLALVMVAIWMWRTTRPDPEFLAPLEAMGERTWRRRDPVWQRRRLDELRPDGAEPLVPSAAPPEIDESFEAGPAASGFDDLHHDGAADEAIVPADAAPPSNGDHADAVREVAEASDATSAEGESPNGAPKSWTPPHLDRALLDGLPESADGEPVAAALTELDAELAHGDQTGGD